MPDIDGPVGETSVPADRLTTLPKPTSPVAVRDRLIDLLRRDLVGPHPDLDPDLAREVFAGVSPSNWYLTGYLGPRRKTGAARTIAAIQGSEATQEEAAEDLLAAQRGSEGMEQGAPGPGRRGRRRLRRTAAHAVVRAVLPRPHRPPPP